MSRIARICEAQRCDNELVGVASERLYCSSACRQSAYRARVGAGASVIKDEALETGLSTNFIITETKDEYLGNLAGWRAIIAKRAEQWCGPHATEEEIRAAQRKALAKYDEYRSDRAEMEHWAADNFQSTGGGE